MINVYKISTESMTINMNIIVQDIVCIMYVEIRRNLSENAKTLLEIKEIIL